jgi:peptidoglycan/xylan/chitin deacetylase (PgdA/CDA1 family)
MDTPHYGGLDPEEEEAQIAQTLLRLRSLTGQAVQGWLSPGRNESANTPDLLAKQGVGYLCDWVNDDMPYPFRTSEGELVALPLSTELEDRFIIQHNLHSEASWQEQVCDACDLLMDEAAISGGRLLALSIHPWLIGQPHRIGKLEAALDYIMEQAGVWSAPPGEIVDCWQSQRNSSV